MPSTSQGPDSLVHGGLQDRAEVLRLSNLLYAFVRHSVRELKIGYSDAGAILAKDLLERDCAARPGVQELLLNTAERNDYINMVNEICATLMLFFCSGHVGDGTQHS